MRQEVNWIVLETIRNVCPALRTAEKENRAQIKNMLQWKK